MLDQLSQAAKQIPTNFIIEDSFITELEASIYRDVFYEYVKAAWHVVEQDTFVDSWHIKLICKALQALYEDKITSNFLIVNVPPRHMKSLLVDVFFPSWIWTKEPHRKFLATSYAEGLIAEHTGKCKKLVNSSWYQERFDVAMAESPDTNLRFANIYGGYVYGFGFGGQITGQGGDYILIDDPMKTTEADSQPVRDKTNEDFDNAVSNRLNDPEKGKRVLIMQRLHERDLVGHIQSKGLRFENIVLPFEYEGERFQSTIGLKDERTEVGEILWKSRWITPAKLQDYKLAYSGDRARAGQLQQRPSPEGGFIFKSEWFPRLADNDDVVETYVSWDTAESVNPDAAFSCGIVTELRSDYSLFIREVVRKRLLFPQLQQEMEELAEKYRATLKAIVIEKKSSGVQAIQTLKQSSPQWLAERIVAFDPKTFGDKIARASVAATWAERQCIYLPHPSSKFSWLKVYEDELFTFPSSAFKDQTDATNQIILYMRSYLEQGWRARSGNMIEIPTLEGVL